MYRQIGVEESKYRVTGDPSPHLQVGKGSRDQLLKFWDPSISRKQLELETSNMACRFITRGTNERNAKLGQKGSGTGHVTYFWNFGTPSISREQWELETSNFACRFITRGTNERNGKLGRKGPGRGHMTYFSNFGTPSISRKKLGLELETSNYACRFIIRATNERNGKLGERWSGRGHVTYFSNFATPSISREVVRPRYVKFGMQIHHQWY